MLCGKRRIKPIQRYTSMGMTQIQHVTEGMCKECAWKRIKLKCKLCDEIIGKGYPKLLAHTVSHYSPSELLYNEEIEENIIFINFESSNTSNQMFEEDNYECTLRCKICRDSFIFKKADTVFSTWIDHVKSHYVDKDLIKKEWIAKDIIHLNYDSVIEITSSDRDKNSDAQHSVIYRELTQREGDAYRNALHRIRNEESITKSKGR
jgi:hypothetical protein